MAAQQNHAHGVLTVLHELHHRFDRSADDGYLLVGRQVTAVAMQPSKCSVSITYNCTVANAEDRDRLVMMGQWHSETVSRAFSDGEQRQHANNILAAAFDLIPPSREASEASEKWSSAQRKTIVDNTQAMEELVTQFQDQIAGLRSQNEKLLEAVDQVDSKVLAGAADNDSASGKEHEISELAGRGTILPAGLWAMLLDICQSALEDQALQERTDLEASWRTRLLQVEKSLQATEEQLERVEFQLAEHAAEKEIEGAASPEMATMTMTLAASGSAPPACGHDHGGHDHHAPQSEETIKLLEELEARAEMAEEQARDAAQAAQGAAKAALEAEERMEQMEREIETAIEQVVQAESSKDTLQKQVAELKEKLAHAMPTNSVVQNKMAEEAARKVLEKQIVELQGRVDEAEEAALAAEQNCEKLEEGSLELREMVKAVEAQRAELQEEYESLDAQVQEAATQLVDYEEVKEARKLSAMKEELSAMREQNTQAEALLTQEKDSWERRALAAEQEAPKAAELQAACGERDELRKRAGSVESELANAMRENAALEGRLEEALATVFRLEDLSASQQTVEQLERERDEWKSRADAAEAQAAANAGAPSAEHMEEAKREVDMWKDRAAAAEEKVAASIEEMKAMEQKMEEIKHEVETWQNLSAAAEAKALASVEEMK
eukprot:gene11068-13087_t